MTAPSGHIAAPELIIFGWKSDDSYVVMGSDKFIKASITVNYSDPEEYVTKTMSGSIVSASRGISEANFVVEAETGYSSDPKMWTVANKGGYGAALRILGSRALPAVADTATHASIAEAVADELEVDIDDDLVQRIAAAVIASGAISAT